MNITIMKNSTALSLAEIQDFLKKSNKIKFKSTSKDERNNWIQSVIMFHEYLKCKKNEKSILFQNFTHIIGRRTCFIYFLCHQH